MTIKELLIFAIIFSAFTLIYTIAKSRKSKKGKFRMICPGCKKEFGVTNLGAAVIVCEHCSKGIYIYKNDGSGELKDNITKNCKHCGAKNIKYLKKCIVCKKEL